MKAQIKSNPWIWTYLGIIISGLILFLWWRLSFLSPILLTLAFFWFLVAPGFALTRLLNFSRQDWSDQLTGWIILGIVYGFGLSLIAIIIGLNIAVLTIVYLVLIGLLLITSFMIDWRRFQSFRPCKIKFDYRVIFQPSSLLIFLSFLIIAAMLIVIGQKGALFRGGDPLYHLAILQKVMGGQALTIDNLSYVKEKFHIAYGFPIWHVFNGVLTKIFNANMFSFWRSMVLPLSALAFWVWWWVSQKIFQNKWLAFFSLTIFAIFTFNWNAGYLFTTLTIPHTLSQLILLPLSIGLALKYIFNPQSGWRDLIVLSVLIILSAAVHLTGYFYYLAVILMTGIIFVLSLIGTADYWPIVKKIGWAILLTVAPFVLLILIMELNNIHLITEAIKFYDTADQAQNYRYADFAEMGLAVKLAYVALPFLFLFIKKNKPLIVIIAGFLLLPLAYMDFLRPWIIKFLSIIWLKRLYANVLWYPIIWSLVLGFIVILLDRMSFTLNKIGRFILNSIMAIIVFLLVLFQINKNLAGWIYDQIFSSYVSQWINQNYILVITLLSLAVLATLFLAKNQSKIKDFFTITKSKNYFLSFSLAAIMIIVLIAPSFNALAGNFVKARYLIKPLPRTSIETLATNRVGQAETVEFIQTKIPPKKVWDTFGGFFYLPVVADVYMSGYNSKADLTYRALYSDKISLDQRLKMLSKAKIEYILVAGNSAQLARIGRVFNNFPDYFHPVYQNKKALIYQVNQANVARDYPKS